MDKQNKINHQDSRTITPEKALELFNDKFFVLHPRESLPQWYASFTDLTQIYTKDPRQRVFAIAAAKKKELDSNEWYEEVRGKDVLAGFFPGTKDKCYVINHEPEILTIFSAAIDLETAEVTILTDIDMSSISSEKFMKLR